MVKHKIAKLAGLAVLASFYSVALPVRLSAAAGRPVNTATGCPKNKDYSAVFAVLLDTTDALSPVQQEIVQKKLDDFAEKVPRYGKLELFSVQPSSDHLIQPLLQVCNPGRGSDTNEWTGNPRLWEKRWHDNFMNPFHNSLKVALSGSIRAKQSPIMEEIQQVSVQAFFEKPQKMLKRLAIVSDMLQNSALLSQYRQPESFEDFEHTPGFVKVRPELSGVDVTILYIRRSSEFKRQGRRHVGFWQSFFTAAGAKVDEVMSVGG
jgi:hypothetical protein